MSYEVIISPGAAEDLAALPAAVQNAVEQEILRLAGNPVQFSRATRFPYPPGQMFQFEHDFEGIRYYLTVLFRYGQDERSIQIFGIGRDSVPL